jgi:cell division protease FtsH
MWVQLTAVDGRRAMVLLPTDASLVDLLAKNNVDITVSEGDRAGGFAAFIGNLLFPVFALAALFLLARGGGAGGMGPGGMGGPMDFLNNNNTNYTATKFEEVPNTGIGFADVAVRPCEK